MSTVVKAVLIKADKKNPDDVDHMEPVSPLPVGATVDFVGGEYVCTTPDDHLVSSSASR